MLEDVEVRWDFQRGQDCFAGGEVGGLVGTGVHFMIVEWGDA